MSETEPRDEVVFEAALGLTPEQRAAYLERTCAGDAELRRRVENLLGAFERAGGFLNEPAIVTPTRSMAGPLAPSEKPGDRIGRYKLMEQIGEGGCGLVYVAEQEEPLRRRVALKIIKLKWPSRENPFFTETWHFICKMLTKLITLKAGLSATPDGPATSKRRAIASVDRSAKPSPGASGTD